MKIIKLSDELVEKVNFIAAAFERDNGFRPSDSVIVFGCIDACFNSVASYIGHGICEGDDE